MHNKCKTSNQEIFLWAAKNETWKIKVHNHTKSVLRVFIYLIFECYNFFSQKAKKKILRYSQYNGIYSVWNETGVLGRVNYSQKTFLFFMNKTAIKLCHLKDLSRKYIHGVFYIQEALKQSGAQCPAATCKPVNSCKWDRQDFNETK